MIVLLSLLTTTLLSSTAAETTTITHSHIYHSSPSSIITSILSNVASSNSQSDKVDIDASFNRLDDDAISTLVERLLDEQLVSDGTKILLGLSGNCLTPRGACSLFDRLVANIGNTENTERNVGLNETSTDDLTIANDENQTLSNDTSIDSHHETVASTLEIEELDLSFNDIGGHGSNSANLDLLNSVRRLMESGRENTKLIPRVLVMENCGIGPAVCRSIGRGILNAFERQTRSVSNYRPSILRLGGNEAIGDPGTVSLAAAHRLAIASKEEDSVDQQQHILDELDLSSCNIGDPGAESLALALAFHPGCISKRLDLSNNQISNVGAIALGRALIEASAHCRKLISDTRACVLEEIVLDNNINIDDEGAEVLAEALACGAVRCISLRSCSVKAGGTAAFGKAIVSLAKRNTVGKESIQIDLSGNVLGIKPIKKKKGLKDKASSHISSFGKTLQKSWRGGLKGAGASMGLTAESDDDEENGGNMGGLMLDADEEDGDVNGPLFEAVARCGSRSFTSEILNGLGDNSSPSREQAQNLNACIAFRRCNLDDGAIDALSAAITELKKKYGANLSVDVSMNTVEPETISALVGEENEAELLMTMAQRHKKALSVLKEARERAAMAADAAMARADAEKQFGEFLFDNDDADSDYDQYDDY